MYLIGYESSRCIGRTVIISKNSCAILGVHTLVCIVSFIDSLDITTKDVEPLNSRL